MRHIPAMIVFVLAIVLPDAFAPWQPWLYGLTILLVGWGNWPTAKQTPPTWRTRWAYQDGQLNTKTYVAYFVSIALIVIVVSGFLMFVVYGN